MPNKKENAFENSDNAKRIPKLLKESLSNLDIFVLAQEFNNVLVDGFFQNIYELNGLNNILLLKCRTKQGKKTIIVDPKKRINFTEFTYPIPQYPSQFIMSLRKFMKGRRIDRVYQYNLDRILVFELKATEGENWKFIIEFFSGGNFILVDGENKIYMAKSYKKMRTREILPKKIYEFPASRGVDLLNLSWKIFNGILEKKKGEIVRVLARNFNIGGYLAEEFCLRAKIDKKTPVEEMTIDKKEYLYNVIEEFLHNLKNQLFQPQIIYSKENNLVDENINKKTYVESYFEQKKKQTENNKTENNKTENNKTENNKTENNKTENIKNKEINLSKNKVPIGFEVMPLLIYKDYPAEQRDTYSECIDLVFSQQDSSRLFSGEIEQSKTKLSKTERILEKQIEKIEQSKIQREENLSKGHLIYQYMIQIDNLINTIMTQKREKKLEWEVIQQKLKEGKKQKIPECMIFEKILPKEVKIEVNLEGTIFKLDLKKSARENAEQLYKVAKKAKKKMVGAEKAIETTKKKIKKHQKEHEQKLAEKITLLKRPKQKWYEKYRWFISSDGFLVVGGRDASSNEALVNKYMEPNDLFFHSDVHGAAVCLIKNPEQLDIPERTIKETAIFASCYSSAWKLGWGTVDIFYVKTEQVSKTPKSGEFLKKGSFYITGKKNYVQKPYLELTLGLMLYPIHIATAEIDMNKNIFDPNNNELDKYKKFNQKELNNERKKKESIIDKYKEENLEIKSGEKSKKKENNSIEKDKNNYFHNNIKNDKDKYIDNNSDSQMEIDENEQDKQVEEEYQYFPQVIAGPESAIAKKTINYTKIIPVKKGKRSSEMAKQILHEFVKKTPKELQKWVRLLSVNDIIRLIPSGESDFPKAKKRKRK